MRRFRRVDLAVEATSPRLSNTSRGFDTLVHPRLIFIRPHAGEPRFSNSLRAVLTTVHLNQRYCSSLRIGWGGFLPASPIRRFRERGSGVLGTMMCSTATSAVEPSLRGFAPTAMSDNTTSFSLLIPYAVFAGSSFRV